MTDAPHPSDSSPGLFFSMEGDSESMEGDSEALAEQIENQEYRDRLDTTLDDGAKSTFEKLQAILHLGAEWLNVENGHLTSIDVAEGTHVITEVSGPPPMIERGNTTDLSTTCCRRVVARSKALTVENAPEQGWDGDPAYEEFELSTYLGSKVVVDGEFYGTACFVDREPRAESVSDADAAALTLIARTIGRVLEREQHEGDFRCTSARLEALFEDSPNLINLQTWRAILSLRIPASAKKPATRRTSSPG